MTGGLGWRSPSCRSRLCLSLLGVIEITLFYFVAAGN